MKKLFMKTVLLILALVMALALTACGKQEAPAELPRVPSVDKAEFEDLAARLAAAEAETASYVYLINASVNAVMS